MFIQDGYHIDNINAQNDPVPDSPTDYDAIVILGGPMGVYDDLSYLQNEQELIRNAIRSDTPLMGVCLGSQLIAQAAGRKSLQGQEGGDRMARCVPDTS